MEGWMKELPTPCYVVDEAMLIVNLELLQNVARRSGAKVLLAQKAFAMHSLYPLMRKYLDGTAASGLFEAKLGAECFGGETHVYSPAYKAEDMPEYVRICDHIIFNSFDQWERFGRRALDAGCECGLRINPECSTQSHAIYDPCAPGSRLGITRANFQPDKLDGISGLHMHTLCEQNVIRTRERTLEAADREVRRAHEADEVAEPRRRAPRHAGGLRRGYAGVRADARTRNRIRRAGVYRAGGGGGAERGIFSFAACWT